MFAWDFETLHGLLTHNEVRFDGHVWSQYMMSPTMEHKAMCILLKVCGACRSKQEFRRIILRYSPYGEALSLTEEVYRPVGH